MALRSEWQCYIWWLMQRNNMNMLIKNGRVVDPANKRDSIFDVLIKDGLISKIDKSINAKTKNTINAKNKIVMPGIIDMHVHLREPGREDIETVSSGTYAAVCSGVTSVCSMPNTTPAIDDVAHLNMLQAVIKKDAKSNVFPAAAITEARRGCKIVDIKALKKRGAVAFSDDGSGVHNESVMLNALTKMKTNNTVMISHCEDTAISKKGVINAGAVATKLGLRGIPRKAEYSFVERDIMLAKKAKAKVHIAHVSCRESVDIIRKAKKQGVNVTAETAPHYFSLTDDCCVTYDTRTKMNPPLRSQEDVDAIKKGLSDGTIDVIASDHAPHGKHEKEIEFENAAFGIIGVETLLSLSITELVAKGVMKWPELVRKISLNPSTILNLGRGALAKGMPADITIIDPAAEWVYKKEDIKSKSKNSPFIDRHFKGRAICTIINGSIAWKL